MKSPINFVIRVQSENLIDIYPQDEVAKAYCESLWVGMLDDYKVFRYPLLAWDGILEAVLKGIQNSGMRAYMYKV
jgi:hypothetical protein